MHIFGAEFIQVAKKEPDGIPFVLKICASEIENRALCLQVPLKIKKKKKKCMLFILRKRKLRYQFVIAGFVPTYLENVIWPQLGFFLRY